MIWKNRNRARKYTEKLFNAFLAMGLVLIGFTGTLVSLVSIHSLRANEIESSQKLLTQFSNSVDTTLSYINTIMLNYSSNRKFRSFLHYYEAMDVDSLFDVSNQLEDMIANNSYIHSIIFYYPQDQLAYVANSGVMPVDSCFDGAFLTSIDPAGASVSRNLFQDRVGLTEAGQGLPLKPDAAAAVYGRGAGIPSDHQS